MPIKRRKTQPPPLPRLNHEYIDAIRGYLMQREGMRRPPDVAAAMLALVVQLHETNQPFPTREHAAAHIGGTKWGLDAAMASALARGDVTIQIGTEISTENNQRDSVVKSRFFTPSKELLEAVRESRTPRRVA